MIFRNRKLPIKISTNIRYETETNPLCFVEIESKYLIKCYISLYVVLKFSNCSKFNIKENIF